MAATFESIRPLSPRFSRTVGGIARLPRLYLWTLRVLCGARARSDRLSRRHCIAHRGCRRLRWRSPLGLWLRFTQPMVKDLRTSCERSRICTVCRGLYFALCLPVRSAEIRFSSGLGDGHNWNHVGRACGGLVYQPPGFCGWPHLRLSSGGTCVRARSLFGDFVEAADGCENHDEAFWGQRLRSQRVDRRTSFFNASCDFQDRGPSHWRCDEQLIRNRRPRCPFEATGHKSNSRSF